MQLAPNLENAVSHAEVVIVGSGLFGLTIAERIASQTSKRVAVVEKRSEIGGNAFSYFDSKTGIEIHKYGSHLFHTSNERVWEYVNSFTKFSNYRHKVFTKHNGTIYSIPINLHTLSQFFGLDLDPSAAREMLSRTRLNTQEEITNFEDKAISAVGLEIYEAFFKNYTKKQWQTDPHLLPSEVFSRLPIRLDLNSDYFDDKYQGLPEEGYGAWFAKMVDSPQIEVVLNTDYFDLKREMDLSEKLIVYTGPVDRYFNYSHGELSWRTLDFEYEQLDVPDFQGTAVMNYADIPPTYTRIHEFKHLHPERKYSSSETIIAREFSRKAESSDEPYYPVNSPEDRRILNLYRNEIEKEEGVFFGGRLGSYQYLDMHMAIASALSVFENQIFPHLSAVNS